LRISLTDEEYDAILLSLENMLERALENQTSKARGAGASIGANEPLELEGTADTRASVWPSPETITAAIEKLVEAWLEGPE